MKEKIIKVDDVLYNIVMICLFLSMVSFLVFAATDPRLHKDKKQTAVSKSVSKVSTNQPAKR